MIQRIQTIYLLLAGIALWLVFVFPLAAYNPVEDKAELSTLDVFNINSADGAAIPNPWKWFFIVTVPVAGLLSFWTLMQYKNRKRQLQLGRFLYILCAVVLGANYYAAKKITDVFPGTTETSYGPAYFLPLIALTFLFLAMRSIRKDEDLVKSLDRIR
jgi:hypothetical protein